MFTNDDQMQEIESKEQDLLLEEKEEEEETEKEEYEIGQSNITLRRCAAYALSCFAQQFAEVTF